MATHTIKTNLRGFKKWAWRKNLNGFFSVCGKELSDAQVRKMVEWAISKGYEYDADIPEEEVVELLNIRIPNMCFRDKTKECDLCHECDIDVSNIGSSNY